MRVVRNLDIAYYVRAVLINFKYNFGIRNRIAYFLIVWHAVNFN